LWCEHSRLPLPGLNGQKDKRGVYELELPRDWLVQAAPFLKILTATLSLVLPVASSAIKLPIDEAVYKSVEKELDLAQKTIDSVGKGLEKTEDLLGQRSFDVVHDDAIQVRGAVLRQLHALLKQKDPGFGGLVRVQNKRQEFLWVHPQFAQEY
jgi:internalin A